jgi:acyl carrier protein
LYHDFCPTGNREIVSIMSASTVRARVRAVLKGTDYLQVDIESLADDADLYAAGLSSHATVNLMLALEEAFDVELPDRLLRRRTFSSVGAMAEALAEIGVKEAA